MKRLVYLCAGALMWCAVAAAAADGRGRVWDPAADKEYSRAESRWAVRWINRDLAYYMAVGVIAKIISKETFYEVQAGPEWPRLPFGQQAALMVNLSRAREITGHPPFFTVRDTVKDETVATVTSRAIEVRVGDEGLFHYVPEPQVGGATFY